MGVASAGSAAVCRDAGTVYFNPAGMTELQDTCLLIGAPLLFENVQFQKQESIFTGNSGSQAGTVLPLLGIYYSYKYSKSARAGLAINSPYGGFLNYGQTWCGRYLNERIFNPTVAINPTLAFEFYPGFSIGGGFTAEVAILTEAAAISPEVFQGNPGDPDGRIRMIMKSVAYGYNAGALYASGEGTRVGVSYRSKIVHKFSGRSQVTPPGTVFALNTVQPFAQFVILSLYQELPYDFALLANAGWENWKIFKETSISSDNIGQLTLPRDWKDTWHAALGFEYRYSDPLMLQAGFSYDSSPTTSRIRTPDLPMDRQLRYATGFIYQVNSCERLSAAFEFLDGGSAAINLIRPRDGVTVLKGTYKKNQIYFLNATYGRDF